MDSSTAKQNRWVQKDIIIILCVKITLLLQVFSVNIFKIPLWGDY